MTTTPLRSAALVASGTALVAATYGLARFGWGLFLPTIRQDVPIGAATAGLVQAGGFAAYCVAAGVAWWLGARPRLVVLLAVLTAGLGAVVIAVGGDAGALATGVCVAGAGAGLASPGLVSLVTRTVPVGVRDDAQTVVNAGTGAGIVAAGALLLVVGDAWRTGWWVVALVVVLAGLATLLADAGPGPRGSGDGSGDGSGGSAGAGEPADAGSGRGLLRPAVAAVLAGASSAAVWTFGPSLVVDAGATGTTTAWVVLGAAGVLGAAAGRLSARWGVRGAWARCAAAAALATAALGLGAGTSWVALGAVAVFGAAYIAMSGVLVVWAVRSRPGDAAGATVVLFVALAAGQAVGAALLGVLSALVPGATAFVVAALVGLVAAGLGTRSGSPVRLRGGSSTPRRAPRRAVPR